jgi:hypothetical protein
MAPGYRPPGYLHTPVPVQQPKQASTGLIVAIVVAVVVVAICVGAAVAIIQNNQRNNGKALGGGTTGWSDSVMSATHGRVGLGMTVMGYSVVVGDGVGRTDEGLGR